MTKNEFILEYALRHGACPETSLLEQLTLCFTEIVIEESQKVTCTSKDYREKTKDYKFARLLIACTHGRYTFPKGFVFEIREGTYGLTLRCNCTLEDSSATSCHYYLTNRMIEDVITKCELLNEGTVSTVIKKLGGHKTINVRYRGQSFPQSRPVYSDFEYKI